MYFGHNYICIYIFIGINWEMTSYFKSSNSFPFFSLYNNICQIPFDRDRDQLQLETVKNSTVVKVGKKRESVYEALLDISNLFLRHKQRQIFGFHTALSTNLKGSAILGKNDKSFETSIKLLSWWCNVVEVETHGNLVDQERHLAWSREAFGPSIWSIKRGLGPEYLVDHERHLGRVSNPSIEVFGPSI